MLVYLDRQQIMIDNMLFSIFVIFLKFHLSVLEDQPTVNAKTFDNIDLNLKKDCVTRESLSATLKIEALRAANFESNILILQQIQQKCSKSEKILMRYSQDEFEHNINEVVPLDFQYPKSKTDEKFSTLLDNWAILSNYGYNRTWKEYNQLAVKVIDTYQSRKHSTLTWLQSLLNLRLERIKGILKTKLGAHIAIFDAGYKYDNIEINDFLSVLNIPSDGYHFYSFDQMDQVKRELKSIIECTQRGIRVCDGGEDCAFFERLISEVAPILFRSVHLSPLYEQLNKDATLYSDLYTVKGEKGDNGADVSRGQKGVKGRKGVSGDKGSKGEKGDQGYPGDDGQRGVGEVGNGRINRANKIIPTITAYEEFDEEIPTTTAYEGFDEEIPTTTAYEGFDEEIPATTRVHLYGSDELEIRKNDEDAVINDVHRKDDLEISEYFKAPQQINFTTLICYKKKCPMSSKGGRIMLPKAQPKGSMGDEGEPGNKGDRGYQGEKGDIGDSHKDVTIFEKGEGGQKGEKGTSTEAKGRSIQELSHLLLNFGTNIKSFYWSDIFRIKLYQRIEIDKMFESFYLKITSPNF